MRIFTSPHIITVPVDWSCSLSHTHTQNAASSKKKKKKKKKEKHSVEVCLIPLNAKNTFLKQTAFFNHDLCVLSFGPT
jgi:hypothetical protein